MFTISSTMRSRCRQRRWRHLDRMTDDLLECKIHPSMLEGEYLARHGSECKLMCDRICYYENIRKDPVNPPFFEQMEPTRKAKLLRFLDEKESPFMIFALLFAPLTSTFCVNNNSGAIQQDIPSLEMQAEVLAMYKELFMKAYQSYEP